MLTLLDNGRGCKDKVHACDLQILVIPFCHAKIHVYHAQTHLLCKHVFVCAIALVRQ